MLPLYLRDEERIRGLPVLLGIALRVLTLTEFVVRRNLAATGSLSESRSFQRKARHI
jgi:transposase